MNQIQQTLTDMVRENIEEYWGEGAFGKTFFFQDSGGCVPEEYIGEDLRGAIHDKFYAVFSAIARVVQEEAGMAFVFTTIAPSCEDTTRVILHGYYRDQEKEVLLLVQRIKAWNLWWPSQEEMGESLERWYNEALQTALGYSPSLGLEGMRLKEKGMNAEKEILALAARLNALAERLAAQHVEHHHAQDALAARLDKQETEQAGSDRTFREIIDDNAELASRLDTLEERQVLIEAVAEKERGTLAARIAKTSQAAERAMQLALSLAKRVTALEFAPQNACTCGAGGVEPPEHDKSCPQYCPF